MTGTEQLHNVFVPTHAASAEGIIVAENIMGKSREIDYRRIPSAIYTFPEIPLIGRRKREARKNGLYPLAPDSA